MNEKKMEIQKTLSVLLEMGNNKNLIKEMTKQLETEFLKISTNLEKLACEKEEELFNSLTDKLRQTKEEYEDMKSAIDKEKLIQNLDIKKNSILYERKKTLEKTLEKATQIQKLKNTFKSYQSQNEDLDSELCFLMQQLTKTKEERPDLKAKMDQIEQMGNIEKKKQTKQADKKVKKKPRAISKENKRKVNKPKDNSKVTNHSHFKPIDSKKAFRKLKTRKDQEYRTYFLDEIFTAVVDDYFKERGKHRLNIRESDKREIFREFLKNSDSKTYFHEILTNEYPEDQE